jgi:hypothetical protein
MLVNLDLYTLELLSSEQASYETDLELCLATDELILVGSKKALAGYGVTDELQSALQQ